MDSNLSLFFWIHGLAGHSNLLDTLMIFGAEPLIYIMILLILLLGIIGKTNDKKAFLLLFLSLPVAFLLIKAVHFFIFEPRPFITFNFTPLVKETADASFPSRHTTIVAAIAFSYLFFKSKWSLLLLPAALWVGISRVYVGVHYPLDILGGFLVGVISLNVALQIKNMLKRFFFLP